MGLLLSVFNPIIGAIGFCADEWLRHLVNAVDGPAADLP